MNKRLAPDELAHLTAVNNEYNEVARKADELQLERQGYLKFLARKYGIPEGGRIESTGEIIAPDAETKSAAPEKAPLEVAKAEEVAE